MSPDQYCRDKLACVASSAHYSLLFLPAARRRAATALYALRRELDEAIENASDPAVARAGLGWWAQEIQHLFEQKPQHPVTRALAPHLPVYGLSSAPFALSLQARLRLLEPAPFDDFDALCNTVILRQRRSARWQRRCSGRWSRPRKHTRASSRSRYR